MSFWLLSYSRPSPYSALYFCFSKTIATALITRVYAAVQEDHDYSKIIKHPSEVNAATSEVKDKKKYLVPRPTEW